MNISKWTIAAACAAAFSSAAVAGPNDVTLAHYESLQQLSLQTTSADAANASQKASLAEPLVMSFDALGQRFDIELEANSRLMSAARQNPLLSGVEIYRGELAGRPGSWARIVVADGMPQGMFWDGQEMYAIEAPGDSIVDTSVPIIYRLADARVAAGSMTCGSMSMATTGAAAIDGLISELGTMSEAQGAIEEIEVGAIGDFEFTSSKGGNTGAATAITNRLNNVDGIFSQQLGIQITVNDIETFSGSNDPFTDVGDAAMLLDELSDYRSVTPTQNRNGLTHLYTGRDLDGSTVGIAWNGALCSNFFGAGLSEGNGSATFDSLVAAHEIGHNFGAPHDGQSGSACESETGQFIMAPQLNGSDQFSSCSIAEMSDDIARATCITALPTVDMQVALAGTPIALFGAPATINYDVVNNGSIDATNVVVDFTIPANLILDSVTPSEGTCTNGAGTISCALGDVPGFAGRTVAITVTPATVGQDMITATVSSDVDERPANNQEALSFSVDPAVDLVVSTPTAANIKLNQTATINATLENRATMDATGVTMVIDLGNALDAVSANWSLGSCTVQSTKRISCQAATFAANSNSTVTITATGILAGNPNVAITLSSVEADLVVNNNSATGRFEVKDKDEDSGSGSTGPLFMLLLASAALLRRRR
jgi:MYXO-CTERM domain-containing protein